MDLFKEICDILEDFTDARGGNDFSCGGKDILEEYAQRIIAKVNEQTLPIIE